MADDEREMELMERWWLRMRRSFAVPDIVTDDHAIDVIMGVAVPEPIRLEHKGDIVTRIVGMLLRLGSQGELDQYVIGDVPGSYHKQKPVLELCHEVVERGADEALEDATMAIIDRMTANIAALPFEDDDGGYFRTVAE
jgi:hypothetical protein